MIILKLYSSLLTKHPLIVQSVQAGTLMAAGDIISQFAIERKTLTEFDVVRPIRFFSLGLLYIGPVLKTWFGVLQKTFGSSSGRTVFKKLAVDQLAFSPIFSATVLTLLGASQGKSWLQIKQFLRINYVDIVLAGYCVWPAVQIVNFWLIPLHHQVLIVQIVAVFWNTYLAWKTNQQHNAVVEVQMS